MEGQSLPKKHKKHKHKKHKKKRSEIDDINIESNLMMASSSAERPPPIVAYRCVPIRINNLVSLYLRINTNSLSFIFSPVSTPQRSNDPRTAQTPTGVSPKISLKKKKGKGRDSGTSSDEERWLDAIQSGKLEEV